MNTQVPGLLESPVCHLIHTHCTRRGPVDLERLQLPGPAPVGSCYRVPRPFHLRERGEQLGRNSVRRMLAEDGRITTPGLRRSLEECATHREEQLGGLADNLIDPVGDQPDHGENSHDSHDPNRNGRAVKAPHPAAARGCGGPKLRQPRAFFPLFSGFAVALTSVYWRGQGVGLNFVGRRP